MIFIEQNFLMEQTVRYSFQSWRTTLIRPDIQFEDYNETLKGSRKKAQIFLRKLKQFGWIEYETANDQTQKVIMPNYAVTMLQTLNSISRRDEMEYQSEISAIYSLLTNEEILNRPYPQVIKPVYERTLSLFTGLSPSTRKA